MLARPFSVHSVKSDQNPLLVERAAMNIELFGTFAIKMSNGSVEQLATNKERALLGYLAAHDQPLSRSHLAGLLWGDHSEGIAKRNLRNALARIKRRVPMLVTCDMLMITHTTVQLRESADFAIDLQAFDRLWSRCNTVIWSQSLSPTVWKVGTSLPIGN